MEKKTISEEKMVAALLTSTWSILEASSFKEAALAVYESCRDLIGAAAGYVALLSEDGRQNKLTFLDAGNLACTLSPETAMLPVRGLRGEVYRRGRIIYQNTFSESKWDRYLPNEHGRLDNVLFAPIVLEEKVLGLMVFANKPGGFSDQDVETVKPYAKLLAVGLLKSRAYEDLEKRENFLHAVLQTASDAIITINGDGAITFWNKAAEKSFGYLADEIIGRPSFLLMPEEYRDLHAKGLDSVAKGNRSKLAGQNIELVGQRKDGSTFPMELSLAEYKTGDRRFYAGIIRDITQKNKAREILRRQHEEIQSLARFPEQNRDPVLRVDKDGVVLYGNPASRELLASWECGIGGRLPDHIGKNVAKSFADQAVGKMEVNHKEKTFFFHITPIVDLGYLNLYGHDVTELKRTEGALRESEELFRTVFQTSPDAININRMADGQFVAINNGFAELSGFTRAEVIGKTTLDLNVWQNVKDREHLYARLNADGQITNFATKFRRKDGRLIDALVSAKRISLGNQPHLLAVTRDITELKKAENALRQMHAILEEKVAQRTAELKEANEELLLQIAERQIAELARQESEMRYATLVEASLTGVHISVDGKIQFANEQFASIFGYGKDEMIGMEAIGLIVPRHRKQAKRMNDRRLQGENVPEEYEIRGRKKNGASIYLLKRDKMIEFRGRQAILGNTLDITERKLAEAAVQESANELRVLSSQLLSAEEAERKRIARDIHDSIGQALSAIKFSVENTLRAIAGEDILLGIKMLRDLIPLTQKSVEEVRRIVMDLRPSLLDDIGITATISWFCREFEALYTSMAIDKEIAVAEEDIPDQLKTVIYRVLQEGLNNAAKHSRAKNIHIALKKKRGRIALLLEDDGIGFEVERTLAQSANRRGMGLASMRERTELSGGSYTILSAQGAGTKIKASWPTPRKRAKKKT
jgi:PAS domain S-box-containing protein